MNDATPTSVVSGQRRVVQARRVLQRHPNQGAGLDVLCDQIVQQASRIAKANVDSSSDCYAYATMVATSRTANDLIQTTAAVHVFHIPEHQARAANGATAAPLPTLDVMNAIRRQLIDTLYNYGSMLTEVYHICGKPASAYDNIIILLLKAYALIFYLAPDDTGTDLEEETIEDNVWAVRSGVVSALPTGGGDGDGEEPPVPVLAYRMSQLTRAIYLLNSRWNELDYSEDLVHYIDLLMIRAGMFLLATFDSHVHDVELLRAVVHKPNEDPDFPFGEYSAAPAFVSSVGSTFVDMLSNVALYLSLPQALAARHRQAFGDSSTLPYLHRAFTDWITRKIDTMVATEPADFLRDHLLHLNLRPGERYGYMRLSNGVGNSTEVQHMISKFRKNEYGELCTLRQRTFADVIKATLFKDQSSGSLEGAKRPRLQRPALFAPEPIELALCLLELIDMHVKSTYQGMVFSDFFILEYEIPTRRGDLTSVDEPIILHVFHRFHIWYKRELYACGSLLKAMLLWLKIIASDLKGVLRTRDLRPWLNDVASMGGRYSASMAQPAATAASRGQQRQDDGSSPDLNVADLFGYDSDAEDLVGAPADPATLSARIKSMVVDAEM